MPFDGKAVRELRKREHLSQAGLAKALCELAGSNDLVRKMHFATISCWELGKRSPIMPHLDLLYTYARSKGHEDLRFYDSQ